MQIVDGHTPSGSDVHLILQPAFRGSRERVSHIRNHVHPFSFSTSFHLPSQSTLLSNKISRDFFSLNTFLKPILAMSSPRQSIYVNGDFSEPMSAQYNFANQFDLENPEQARMSYQKFVSLNPKFHRLTNHSSSGLCTSTPSSNLNLPPHLLVVGLHPTSTKFPA